MIRLLIVAGHNSMTSAVGNTLLHAARSVDDQQRSQENIEELPAEIEEMLRYEAPVQSMPRYLTADTVLHGKMLREGERVDLIFGAANRDEQAFEKPERCVLDRKPNRHIAFGHGIHTCLGAPIARMEIRVAFEQLLEKTKSFAVNGEVTLPPCRLGVDTLPVTIEV
jgi:cytochrome P450